MNLTKIKEWFVTREHTRVVWNVEGSEFAFNVHKTVSMAKAEEFVDIVRAEVIRDGAFHFALIEPAMDFATVCIFTDINMLEWDREEAYALATSPVMTHEIDKHVNPAFLFNLRNAARKEIEYYLELAKPQSNSEKAYEAVAELLGKLDTVVDVLADKVSSFDVSEDDISSIAQSLKRFESVGDDKILEYVMNKEN